MGELLCHLFGDFALQNQWLANNKAKSSWACLIHVVLYTLPFLVLTRNPDALVVIAATHFVIDRFSLGRKWPAFWGVGEEGWLWRKWREFWIESTAWRWHTIYGLPFVGLDGLRNLLAEERPPLDPAPDYLRVWLQIINDNALHLLINHVALLYTAGS